MAPTKRLDSVTCECGRPTGQCIKADDGSCDAPMPDEWVDCPACGGEGIADGECSCMDDTCCCFEPTPPDCDICKGNGGWIAK